MKRSSKVKERKRSWRKKKSWRANSQCIVQYTVYRVQSIQVEEEKREEQKNK